MSPRTLLFFSICFITFWIVVFFSAGSSSGQNHRDTVKERIKAVLDYLETVQEFVNLDGYVALGFTQKFLYESYKQDEETGDLLALNDKLLNGLYKKIADENPDERFMIELVFDHSTKYSINTDPSHTSPTLPAQVSKFRPKHPKVQEAVLVIDFCLTELGRKGCGLSQFCRRTMSGTTSTMYTATHQVLYQYFILKLGCPYQSQSLAAATSICSNILEESSALQVLIAAGSATDHCHLDLWLEQITFCGALLNDRRFLGSDWLDSVLTLSSSYPCIAKTVHMCNHNDTIEVVGDISEEFDLWREHMKKMEHLKDGTRYKRSDVEAPGGCSIHATGLLLSVLAKFNTVFVF